MEVRGLGFLPQTLCVAPNLGSGGSLQPWATEPKQSTLPAFGGAWVLTGDLGGM